MTRIRSYSVKFELGAGFVECRSCKNRAVQPAGRGCQNIDISARNLVTEIDLFISEFVSCFY